MIRILLVCVAACLAVGGATPDKPARQIEERFLSPCCWSENVAVHNSPAAAAMRGEIEKFVAAGQTEEQIVSYYVRLHGERILREPRGNKRLILTLGPILAALIGGVVLIGYLRRVKQTPPAAATAVAAGPFIEDDLEW